MRSYTEAEEEEEEVGIRKRLTATGSDWSTSLNHTLIVYPYQSVIRVLYIAPVRYTYSVKQCPPIRRAFCGSLGGGGGRGGETATEEGAEEEAQGGQARGKARFVYRGILGVFSGTTVFSGTW